MIDRLEIHNVRRHRHTQLKLRPLTILAGPNGTGKSTVLQALETTFGGSRPFPPAALRDNEGWAGTVAHAGDLRWEYTYREGPHPEVLDLNTPWPNVANLRLRADTMRPATPITQANSTLEHDGSNLAGVLSHLTLLRDGRLEAIEADLQRLVPGLSRVFTENLNVGSIAQVALSIEFEGVGRIPAHQLSDGTLYALALLTALRLDGIGLLLLDDPEQGLHMDAQIELMKCLRGVMEQMPELQVVISTHSPFIMEGAAPEQIVLLGLNKVGETVVASLSEHPDAERLLKILTPGEMWTTIPSDWMHSA